MKIAWRFARSLRRRAKFNFARGELLCAQTNESKSVSETRRAFSLRFSPSGICEYTEVLIISYHTNKHSPSSLPRGPRSVFFVFSAVLARQPVKHKHSIISRLTSRVSMDEPQSRTLTTKNMQRPSLSLRLPRPEAAIWTSAYVIS
jgi:hypothetical protein